MYHSSKLVTLLTGVLLLGCRDTALPPTIAPGNAERSIATEAPTSIASLIDCGPGVPVAHRATSRNWSEPENSLSSLRRVIAQGIPIAEVDVASTSDGVHFLYHDSEWEEDSTCEGDVATTPFGKLDECRLERDGRVSADTPPRLETALDLARGRIALEIDFKRSADYATVVETIRNAGMAEDVILIAYTDGQARRLRQLAPEMWISTTREGPTLGPRTLRWWDRDAPGTDTPSIARRPDATFHVSDRAGELDWSCGG